MSRTIELPDDLYESLVRVARIEGVTPAVWIAKAVPAERGGSDERTVADRLGGLLGAVDSTEESDAAHIRSPFSELIADKFQKQGLRGA